MIQRTPPFTPTIEDAQALGVRPGPLEESPLSEWHKRDPWCAPLVMAGAVEVFDFTKGYDANRTLTAPYGIGRYDEDRKGMYTTELFRAEAQTPRTIHMGLDIGAGEGTPVFSPVHATVWGTQINRADGDYGGTVILKSTPFNGHALYMLFGHLSHASTRLLTVGDSIAKGQLVGWLGGKKENGGWNPHLHWQVSRLEPLRVDLPGAVTAAHRDLARRIFPDPTEVFELALAGWR